LSAFAPAVLAQSGGPADIAAARAELREARARLPAGHAGVIGPMIRVARASRDAGLYGDAVDLMREAIGLRERQPAGAPGRQFLPNNLAELGAMLLQAGRPQEALPVLRRALPLVERGAGDGLGPTGVITANVLGNLVTVLRAVGRPQDSQPLAERELGVRRRLLREAEANPSDRERLANSWRLYGWALLRMDRRSEAIPAMARAIEIREQARTGDLVNWLIEASSISARIEPVNAERYARRALSAAESSRAPGDPVIATALHRLGEAQYFRGQFAEAAASLQRALAIQARAAGDRQRAVAGILVSLGRTDAERANFGDAEARLHRAIEILERLTGADSAELADALGVLGYVQLRAGRPHDAEPLARRALELRQRNFGPNSSQIAGYVTDLGRILYAQRRYAEALALFERAARLRQGEGATSLVLSTLHQLQGETLWRLGRLDEAEASLRRSQEMRARLFGAEAVRAQELALPLARLQRDRGRPDLAEPALRRLAHALEDVSGPDHPRLAWIHHELGLALRDQRRLGEAFVALRRAIEVVERRGAGQVDGDDPDGGAERLTYRSLVVDYVGLAEAVERGQPDAFPDAVADGFAAAQIMHAGATTGALARMADRLAASDPTLAEKLRRRSDVGGFIAGAEAQLRVAFASGVGAEVARLRQQLAGLRREHGEIGGLIAREHPQYQRLIGGAGASLPEIQRVLAADEAMLQYVVGGRRTLLFVIRRDRALLLAVDAPAAWLAEQVSLLRSGLEVGGAMTAEQLPRFDLSRSHELYRRVFAPAQPYLDGVNHIFIVADHALQSVPFGILVSEAPEPYRPGADLFAAYRTAAWLSRRYALTTLPSAMALRALREIARTSSAPDPFIGFGDPTLRGPPGSVRGILPAGLYSRGAIDLQRIRELPALPDTAGELRALARSLGAGDDRVHLRDQATVAQVRNTELRRYRVVAFATHGLTAGELDGVIEPGLVLTPPEHENADDDGILAASEIASLRLDAEWVILSACNTAAPGAAPGAEALSGLARAFFYAGTRAILVSHWSVASDATARLTTGLFEEAMRAPSMRRSEALRRSMLRLIEDSEHPLFAHPLFWAPFVVVGEGGAPPG
jgi:CHAT domain-containing protein/tetratricopeptide (TPR) repeat protein